MSENFTVPGPKAGQVISLYSKHLGSALPGVLGVSIRKLSTHLTNHVCPRLVRIFASKL